MSDILIVALVLWLEARGEGPQGIRAVADVIYNRAQERKLSPAEVVKQPKQFSCLNGKTEDALRREFDYLADKSTQKEYEMWQTCMWTARQLIQGWYNPALSANHYYNPALCSPAWASKLQDKITIGNHTFGRI